MKKKRQALTLAGALSAIALRNRLSVSEYALASALRRAADLIAADARAAGSATERKARDSVVELLNQAYEKERVRLRQSARSKIADALANKGRVTLKTAAALVAANDSEIANIVRAIGKRRTREGARKKLARTRNA